MNSNHFGWSLSDAVDDPRRTGLANFRHKLLLQQHTNPLSVDNEELVASASPVMAHCSADETLAESSASNPVKPYYGREPSVSQWSDSCFGSEYPSLTSTGSSEPESTIMARTWMASSGASRSTGWVAAIDDASRTSSGPSSTSTDCWRGSIHHALAVMEHREEEISSLFDQLHEIEDDLTSMNNQVGQVSHSLQQCQRRKDSQPKTRSGSSSLYQSHSVNSLHRQNSFSSFIGRRHRRCVASSCRDLNSLTEDEMADIVHRLLTRICEFSLARQEGRNDIPLIV